VGDGVKRAAHLETIDPRQEDVEDHQIVVAERALRDRIVAVADDVDGVAGFAQIRNSTLAIRGSSSTTRIRIPSEL
jgi:hypothetical protein